MDDAFYCAILSKVRLSGPLDRMYKTCPVTAKVDYKIPISAKTTDYFKIGVVFMPFFIPTDFAAPPVNITRSSTLILSVMALILLATEACTPAATSSMEDTWATGRYNFISSSRRLLSNPFQNGLSRLPWILRKSSLRRIWKRPGTPGY